MKPLVSIIMGSLSDMPVMEEAIDFLKKMEVPIEVRALSAHRTPDLVATYAKEAAERGVQVIIAGAGGAAHLPGIIAAHTCLPVIGVPSDLHNLWRDWIRSCLYCKCLPAFRWPPWP